MLASFLKVIIASLCLSQTVNADGHGPIEPKVTAWDYMHDNIELQGFYTVPDGEGPFPAVVIVPDWDGVNEYEKIRATMVAKEMGYVAFAADIYGKDLHNVPNITERIQLAGFYRSNPDIFTGRIQEAVKQVSSLEQVTDGETALMGYCFGGTGVLMYALSGKNDVLAVVSFHGGLLPLEKKGNDIPLPKVLVLSGGADDTYTDVSVLEDTLDNSTAIWEISRYSNIEHAFTVFDDDRYNEWADLRSWESAAHFLEEIFGEIEFEADEPDDFDIIPIEYEDFVENETISLTGYLAEPNESFIRPLPVVVVFPDWDGVNDFEKKRATMLAEMGYIAFAADIYGSDLQNVEELQDKIDLVTIYFSDIPLYVQRMQAAIDVAAKLDGADPDSIAIIGYCFGGSGVLQYGLSGSTGAKVAVAYHGNFFTDTAPTVTETIYPYMLILSGGNDPAHGNQTLLEEALNSGGADWEITVYSYIEHSYTKWGNPAYDARADTRSWESMKTCFLELLPKPINNADILEEVEEITSSDSAFKDFVQMLSDLFSQLMP